MIISFFFTRPSNNVKNNYFYIFVSSFLSVKLIVINCPICKIKKPQLIDKDLITLRKSINKGMLLLKISKYCVCEHEFYIELDKNYDIRNTYTKEKINLIYSKTNHQIL